MRRKTILALIFVFTAAVAAFLLPAAGPKAQAQQSCPSFHALLQAELFPENPVRPGDVWGGNAYAFLDQNDQALVGRFSGEDGEGSWQGKVGMGRGGSYAFDFGNGNTFTAGAIHATFPNPAGTYGFGMYQSSWKIQEGTGRFANASGNLFTTGPYTAWSPDGEHVYGRWNGEVKGNICGVE